jgi:hypothetical protein
MILLLLKGQHIFFDLLVALVTMRFARLHRTLRALEDMIFAKKVIFLRTMVAWLRRHTASMVATFLTTFLHRRRIFVFVSYRFWFGAQ